MRWSRRDSEDESGRRERRRLTGAQVRAGAGVALLAVVVGAPVVASGAGLMAAGRDALGLSDGWELLVPLVLDAAAAYAAVLSFRDVLAGDAAAANRLLVWLYATLSAGLNVAHALDRGAVEAAAFFGAASISAVVLWDRTLRATRRDQLRTRGAVAVPTPRFRAARWLVAPGETAAAWRLAVVEGLTDPAEAVTRARVELERRRAAKAAGADQAPPAMADRAPHGDVAGMSKAQAIRAALRALGADAEPRAVARWLAARGVQVGETYVLDVRRRDAESSATSDDTGPTPVRPVALPGAAA